MKIYTDLQDLRLEKHCVVTIGTFDGVHLGHGSILTRISEIAGQSGLETLVFTFNPHPRMVLFPDQTDLKLLSSTGEKRELLKKRGIQHLLEFPFTREFAAIDPRKYVAEILFETLKMRKIVIGYDHRFGKNRAGSIDLLREMGLQLGFEVEEIAAKDVDEINISSTRIRKALEEGKIQLANVYLGYEYYITGTVVEGKKLGRQLGYPTANIEAESAMKLIPKMGVYAVKAEICETGMCYKGMMNIGLNPTTDSDDKLKIEVNLFEFEGDLYNKKMKISVVDYIRPELKFPNLEELKKAIAGDKVRSLEILA